MFILNNELRNYFNFYQLKLCVDADVEKKPGYNKAKIYVML